MQFINKYKTVSVYFSEQMINDHGLAAGLWRVFGRLDKSFIY